MVRVDADVVHSRYTESWVAEYGELNRKIQETLDHVFTQKWGSRGEIPSPDHAFLEPVVEELVAKLSTRRTSHRPRKAKRGRKKITCNDLALITRLDWGGQSALQRLRSLVQQAFARQIGLFVHLQKLLLVLSEVQRRTTVFLQVLQTHDDRISERFIPVTQEEQRLQDVVRVLLQAKSFSAIPDDLLDFSREENRTFTTMLHKPRDLIAFHVASLIRFYQWTLPYQAVASQANRETDHHGKRYCAIQSFPFARRLVRYESEPLEALEKKVRAVDATWREGDLLIELEKLSQKQLSLPSPPAGLFLKEKALSSLIGEDGEIAQREERFCKEVESVLGEGKLSSLLSSVQGGSPVERLEAIAGTLGVFTEGGLKTAKRKIYGMALQLSFSLCALFRTAQIAARASQERRIVGDLRAWFAEKSTPSTFLHVTREEQEFEEELREYWIGQERLSVERMSMEGIMAVAALRTRVTRYYKREGVSTVALLLQSYARANFREAIYQREQKQFSDAEEHYRHIKAFLQRPLLRKIIESFCPTLLLWLERRETEDFFRNPLCASAFIESLLDFKKQKKICVPLRNMWSVLIGKLENLSLCEEFERKALVQMEQDFFGLPPPSSILDGLAKECVPSRSALDLHGTVQSALSSMHRSVSMENFADNVEALVQKGVEGLGEETFVRRRVGELLQLGAAFSRVLRRFFLDASTALNRGDASEILQKFALVHRSSQLHLASPLFRKLYGHFFSPTVALLENEEVKAAARTENVSRLGLLLLAESEGRFASAEYGEYLESIS